SSSQTPQHRSPKSCATSSSTRTRRTRRARWPSASPSTTCWPCPSSTTRATSRASSPLTTRWSTFCRRTGVSACREFSLSRLFNSGVRKMLDLKKLESEVQYVTNQSGEKTAVIVPIEEFEELLEDVEDLAAVAERRDEPTVSHDELLTELKQDGLNT